MKNKWVQLLQDCTFVQLFYLWVLLGIGFGSIYYLVSLMPQNALLSLGKPLSHGLFDFLNMIYFSFVTLTSTGYGDIVPLGLSKIVSIVEIVCGMIVFGFLISKLVSSKQERILEGLYDISFEEKVSRLRSTLYAYRSNISRIIDRIESTRRIKNFDMIDLETNLEGLRGGINNIGKFLITENKNPESKVTDRTISVLFNNLILSVTKVIEILNLLNTKKYDWKQKAIVKEVSECISTIKELQKVYETKTLRDDLRVLLKTIEDSLRQLEDLVK